MEFYYEEDEVVSIEEVECDSLRYDITVSDNHNFFANGILVHNCENFIPEFLEKYRDHTWEVSLKLDGSSFTGYYNPTEDYFGVCSRNLDLKESIGNTLWDTANKLLLKEKLRSFYSITGTALALQAELMGPGIQGNREKFQVHDIYVFNIWDVKERRYLNSEQTTTLAYEFGLMHVPVYETRKFDFTTAQEFLDYAETYLDGKSINHKIREGLVFKSIDDPMVSFKAISRKFLLKED